MTLHPDQQGLSSNTEDDTLDALLREGAYSSGEAVIGLGLRLRPGDTLREGRLEIVSRIGEGGMGVVYEAIDRERQSVVALKTLSRLDAENVYRLKREFRSLIDVSHHNLCRLYELFSEGGDWFFTMELVRGTQIDRWLRPDGGPLQVERLRDALAQLCEGVEALHEAGKLHRDLKPSNVLVSEDGRVVLLDFGLVADLDGGGGGQTLIDGSVSGTPAYMAPEQASGEAASTASDVYAIGVMLFEALVGRLPFSGRRAAVLSAKQRDLAPSVTAQPEDLARLCDALLARDQGARPSIAQLRALLSRDAPPRSAANPGVGLAGREAELAVLRAAFARTLAGTPVLMLVSGDSGLGKSALVTAFLEELTRSGKAVTLAGRCFEQENLPFSGFDALVDDLSRYLRRLSREAALELLPRDAFALARVFPVLQRVAVLAEAPVRPVEDPQELRRRAFAAFHELLGRIRDRRPLCMFIDDLQWVDHDSMSLMRALLVDRDPGPTLMVLTFRSQGIAQNPLLASVIGVAEANFSLHVERLALAPLPEDSARELALHSVGLDVADVIAREAGGNPFFVLELARYAARGGVASVSLQRVLDDHLAALSPEARKLLELSALAGRPMPVPLLLAAASASHDALDELRTRHLVRVSSAKSSKTLECYHDRIRETIAAQLADRPSLHAALAAQLLAGAHDDPELLVVCLEGSGRTALASLHAALAANRAEQAMAFDGAAALYQKALELAVDAEADRQAYRVALANALSNAGRASEAAKVYLEASAHGIGPERTTLRRLAADELVTAGYWSQGEQLVRELCSEVGYEMPRTHGPALAWLALSQTRLRFANLQPAPATLDSNTQLELEVLQTATRLMATDPVFGGWACDQYLLRALAAREPEHLARALALQVYVVNLFTPGSEKRIAQLHPLAERHSRARPELEGNAALMQGAGIVHGRALNVQSAREQLQRALELLRTCRGGRYDIDNANTLPSMVLSSDMRVEAHRNARLVEEALLLGRVWCAMKAAALGGVPRLAAGDASGMRFHLEQASELWRPNRRPQMQWLDLCYLYGRSTIAHYHGEPDVTEREFSAAWDWFSDSPLRLGSAPRAMAHGLRGTSSIWLARRGVGGPELLVRAREDLEQSQRAKVTVYASLELAMRAGLALAKHDRESASRMLREYIERPPSCCMLGGLDQHAAKRRLGQLLAGDEGASWLAEGDACMRASGVVDLESTTRMILPGCHIDS
jgi:eukaryotic-like serine/threonine-protein kinase